LVGLVLHGRDERALGKLFNLLFPRLVRFSVQITRNVEVSEDIVSEVFLLFWQNASKIDSSVHGVNYLYRLVKNKSINALRDAKMPHITLDELGQDLVVQSSLNALESSELEAMLQHEIAMLPERCRSIFLMVKEDGLKYKEVAMLLDVSPKTVEAQMSIALKRLRHVVEKF
jgi:RNA polymerase sigma-70 factor (ECF subfamily)